MTDDDPLPDLVDVDNLDTPLTAPEAAPAVEYNGQLKNAGAPKHARKSSRLHQQPSHLSL